MSAAPGASNCSRTARSTSSSLPPLRATPRATRCVRYGWPPVHAQMRSISACASSRSPPNATASRYACSALKSSGSMTSASANAESGHVVRERALRRATRQNEASTARSRARDCGVRSKPPTASSKSAANGSSSAASTSSKSTTIGAVVFVSTTSQKNSTSRFSAMASRVAPPGVRRRRRARARRRRARRRGAANHPLRLVAELIDDAAARSTVATRVPAARSARAARCRRLDLPIALATRARSTSAWLATLASSPAIRRALHVARTVRRNRTSDHEKLRGLDHTRHAAGL